MVCFSRIDDSCADDGPKKKKKSSNIISGNLLGQLIPNEDDNNNNKKNSHKLKKTSKCTLMRRRRNKFNSNYTRIKGRRTRDCKSALVFNFQFLSNDRFWHPRCGPLMRTRLLIRSSENKWVPFCNHDFRGLARMALPFLINLFAFDLWPFRRQRTTRVTSLRHVKYFFFFPPARPKNQKSHAWSTRVFTVVVYRGVFREHISLTAPEQYRFAN